MILLSHSYFNYRTDAQYNIRNSLSFFFAFSFFFFFCFWNIPLRHSTLTTITAYNTAHWHTEFVLFLFLFCCCSFYFFASLFFFFCCMQAKIIHKNVFYEIPSYNNHLFSSSSANENIYLQKIFYGDERVERYFFILFYLYINMLCLFFFLVDNKTICILCKYIYSMKCGGLYYIVCS